MGDWREKTPSIEEKLNYILANEETGQDVQFIVGPYKTKIMAHSFILQLASSKFNDQLKRNGKSENGSIQIELPDIKPEAMKFLLNHIYKDIPADMWESNLLLDVIQVSNLFGMYNFASSCKYQLMKVDITVDNAARLYSESSNMKMAKLIDKSKNFIFRNAEKVLQTPEFQQISQQNLAMLVQSDYLYVDELLLFRNCIRWAEAECGRVGLDSSNGSNLRSVLGNIMSLIRFPLMSIESFTLEVVAKQILIATEVIELYQHLSLKHSTKRDQLPRITNFSCTERKLLVGQTEEEIQAKNFADDELLALLEDTMQSVSEVCVKNSSDVDTVKTSLENKKERIDSKAKIPVETEKGQHSKTEPKNQKASSNTNKKGKTKGKSDPQTYSQFPNNQLSYGPVPVWQCYQCGHYSFPGRPQNHSYDCYYRLRHT